MPAWFAKCMFDALEMSGSARARDYSLLDWARVALLFIVMIEGFLLCRDVLLFSPLFSRGRCYDMYSQPSLL